MYFFQKNIENFFSFNFVLKRIKQLFFYIQNFFQKILKSNIIFFYIFREISFNYVGIFLFLMITVYVEKIFQVVSLIIEYNIPLYPVLIILPLYFPLVAEYVMPISVVLATIISMGILSDHQEIIAMRACGVSFFRIALPVISFGFCILFFMLTFFEFFLPQFKKKYRLAEIRLIQINPSGELVKKLQFVTIDGIIISVESIFEDRLENILIKFPKANKFIFAPYGYLLGKDEEKNVYPLILYNTTVQPMYLSQKNKNLEFFDYENNARQIIYIKDHPIHYYRAIGYQYFSLSEFYKTMAFKRAHMSKYLIYKKENILYYKLHYNNLNMDYYRMKLNSLKYSQEEQLSKRIEKKNIYLYVREQERKLKIDQKKRNKYYENIYYYFHRAFAFAFSSVAFTLIGISLALMSTNKRSGKTLNIGFGIIIIAIYFLFNFLGEILLQKNIVSNSFIAAWLPNFIFYTLGFYLLIKHKIIKTA